MASLLVTGGAGFIGANFVHYWLARYPEDRLVVLDALTYAGRRENLAPVLEQPALRFVHGDIRDQALVERLLREESLDTVVHFAAESHVDRSISGPAAFVETNVTGTLSLLQAAQNVWLAGSGRPHRFHHVSTDEVYGSLGPADPAFTETTAYAPNSPYSASKAASDHLVRAWHHTYGLQVTTSNCSNNYGPYQFPEKLIPLMLTRLLHGESLPVYGDGRNVRDWLHVEDHARGIEQVLRRGRVGEVYNIGGENEWNNIALVRLICARLDETFAARPELSARYPEAAPARGEPCESLIRFVRDRPGHDARYAINPDKVRAELDFRPAHTLESGLAATMEWYLAHPQWWRPLCRAAG
ncbi:dTDP-glucose 4,6-dehydratase [Alkalilimnicola sp. S0819]|uniref:dTDP-glucose 4,6-dehydratase n=1 Tax=Alkalilimnicola sp. S0819 TaxID=2613922 RepID=UPI001262130E|nr:dTDP-glucose 4,6-dehydratase [Alkalilimnicola sp. S0819]KAB7627328.1 dTDP-glucose 4,6-dehydratase [Alkalilimnicola sp. S0819]MPQ16044.1 dTDP-glucose 4,6-dehydratase [Alkalilimnicola sp. S0819]